MDDRCERCGKKTRQVVTTPLGEIVQDWNAESGRSVAEIDEDICDRCGEDVIAACEEYQGQEDP